MTRAKTQKPRSRAPTHGGKTTPSGRAFAEVATTPSGRPLSVGEDQLVAGAALLARRVLAAVAAGDPVIATGRAFAPKFVGAVAGAKPGQQLSFARLMRDATRALDQARHDGAELAIQP